MSTVWVIHNSKSKMLDHLDGASDVVIGSEGVIEAVKAKNQTVRTILHKDHITVATAAQLAQKEMNLPAGTVVTVCDKTEDSVLEAKYAVYPAVTTAVADFAAVKRHLADVLSAAADVHAVGYYPIAPMFKSDEHIRETHHGHWNAWASSPVWAVRLPLPEDEAAIAKRHLVGIVPLPPSAVIAPPTSAAVQWPSLEKRPYFSESHYPTGVNSKFDADAKTLMATFAGEKGILEGEGRELAVHADSIVKTIQELLDNKAPSSTGPGERILLELGCGTGLFTQRLCKIPSCHVVATDAFAGFIEGCVHRRTDGIISGHVTLQHTPIDALPHLPSGCVSMTVIIDVYHHLEYPLTMMRDIRRGSHQGALLLLVDFHRDDAKHYSHGPGWITEHVRGDQATFESEIGACGFEKVQELSVDGLRENYAVLFRAV